MMRSPMSVWRSMNRHSPASSGPGFSRISSGIATLPTSCSSAAMRTCSTSPDPRPSVAATPSASVGDVGDVVAQLGVALGEDPQHHLLRLVPRRSAGRRACARRGAGRRCAAPRWPRCASPGQEHGAVRAADREALAGLVERGRAGRRPRGRRRGRAARRTRRRPCGTRGRGPRPRAPRLSPRRWSSASPEGWPKLSL